MKRLIVLGVSACTALSLIGCGGPSEEEFAAEELGVEEQEAITCTGAQGDAYGNGPEGGGVINAIRNWFGTGARGDTAMRVAKCESGYWANCCAYGGGTKAHYEYSSQYKGLFQMGQAERDQYGFTWCAPAQAEAASKMQAARGWSPWSCY
ncbi:hypothetical protein ATI61_111312 [Archangium gephyra]|uniref:Uncharacterized protein n=1 Tax=Archangium gephyra TaxID=48 RepID=A0AAC8QH29_9BACT|nr:hypothetical protein [Archangium gephyra]AKJ07360.1 Hypothetical protein AA314_08986 [Archangium gephyra]REG26761.1 hypothetical protein ATI61_111312 [Archangium gephyra]